MNAPFRLAHGETANPSFIRELCLTLDHRWVPEHPFVLFTGFIDESDTHGPKPDVIMSAFLGSAVQWERFDRGLRRLQRRDGFKVLHATDFKGLTGEFSGWSGPKCMRLINDLVEMFRDELTEAIVTSLPYATYRDEFLAKLPHKMPRASQYGVCFQATLERILGATASQRGKKVVSIVLEDGHKNAGDAARIFRERRERYRKMGADVLRTFTLGSKQDSPELMAADFLAHTFGMISRKHPGGVQGYGDMTQEMPKPRESGITIQLVTPEYIQMWRDEFEADGAARREDWVRRKAAWQASQGQSS